MATDVVDNIFMPVEFKRAHSRLFGSVSGTRVAHFILYMSQSHVRDAHKQNIVSVCICI